MHIEQNQLYFCNVSCLQQGTVLVGLPVINAPLALLNLFAVKLLLHCQRPWMQDC